MVFHIVSLNNNHYKIEKEDTESNDEFFHRCWFVAKKNPSNSDFNDAISLSKISRNVKFLNVIYSDKVMNMIKV